jgi:hypothetical protein
LDALRGLIPRSSYIRALIAQSLDVEEDIEGLRQHPLVNETKPMPKVVPTKKPVECDHPEWEKVGSMFKQCTKCGERVKR